MPPRTQKISRTRRSRRVGLSVCAAALLAADAAEAQPRPGRYQARPAPVVTCSTETPVGCGTGGELTGWVEVEVTDPIPGSRIGARFVASDLVLRMQPLDLGNRFPGSGRLSDLEPFAGAGDSSLRAPAEAPQSAELELWWPRDDRFLLRGYYFEGCCGGTIYEIDGVLFDWVGPAGEPPALRPLEGRFTIRVTWRDGQGGSGQGSPVALDDRSGIFWFFRPDNPELLVKVIDACEPFGRWWFFAAGLTDVEVVIRVEGPGGGRTYTRPAGEPFAPILDTDALPCVEPAGDSAGD